MDVLRRIERPFLTVAIAANAVGAVVIYLLIALMNADYRKAKFKNRKALSRT